MPVLCFIIHGIGTQTQEFFVPLRDGVLRELKGLVAERKRADSAAWQGVEAADLFQAYPLYWADVGTAQQANLFMRLYPDLVGQTSRLRRFWDAFVKFAPARS